MYIPQKISEKEVLNNGYLKILEKKFVEKDGSISNYLIRGTASKRKGGVGICALTKDKKIIYIKEYRKGIEDVIIEFPGGMKENNEKVMETAKKELLEETGYQAKNIKKLTKMITGIYSEGKDSIFVAWGCEKKTKKHLESGENIQVYTASISEFEKMIFSGKIVLAKTIATYFLAKEKTKNFTDFDI